MVKNNLENMSSFEYFSNIKILDDTFFAIRVDGRSFHSEVKKLKMKRPFDRKLRNAINKAIKEVMKDFGCVFAYTESDEATFLFPKSSELFDRRVEKLVSLVASKMSVVFAKSSIVKKSNIFPTFDARVLVLPSKSNVIKCFQWRQMDSHRNAISTQCFWRLIKKRNYTERKASNYMKGMKDSDKNELLYTKLDCNYNKTPFWERKGTMFYLKEYLKVGYNPIKKRKEKALRKIIICEDVKVYFRKDNLKDWINKGIKIV